MNEKPKRRHNLPSKTKIFEHWEDRVHEFGIYEDFQGMLSDEECWACGKGPNVQRCHIVPYSRGGSDVEENLVLLCPTCHVDSEGLQPTMFWRWMREMRRLKWQTPLRHSLERFAMPGYSFEGTLELFAKFGGEVGVWLMKKEFGLPEEGEIK